MPAKIVFFAPFGLWSRHEQINAILGASLRERGAEVLVVGCDGSFRKSCYILGGGDSKQTCADCCYVGSSLYKSFDLPLKYLRQYTKDSDLTESNNWLSSLNPDEYVDAHYGDLPVGSWVTPIICSYFKITPARMYLPKVQEVTKKYLFYSLITYKAMQRLIDEYKPTNIIMYSGGGMVHGAALCAAERNNIPCLTHTVGRAEGSYMYAANEIISAFRNRQYVAELWKDIPLSEEECKAVKFYFDERRRGINHNHPIYHEGNQKYDVHKLLNIPRGAKIVGAFTSSEYEKVYYPEYKNVPSQIDILRNLIDVFKGREEYLVIRHHPQIGGGEVEDADTEFLTGAYELAKDAPPNVRIIMPHESVNTYWLFWNIDASFAPFTTAGLESLSAGIPTLCSLISPYSSGIPFAIDKFDKETLELGINFILSEEGKVTVDHLRLLYRFMDAFTNKHSQVLKSVHATTTSDLDIRIKDFSELRPGNDEVLDRLCNHILTGSNLYEEPSPAHRSREDSAETKFLTDELNDLERFREQVRNSKGEDSINPSPVIEVLRLRYKNIPERNADFCAWQNQQRHRSFNVSEIEIDSFSNHIEIFKKIAAFVEQNSSNYLLITNDSIQYDEAFITLSQQNIGDGKLGCLFGGWVCNAGIGIEKPFFIKRHPTDEYEKALSYFDLFRYPQTILSFCVISAAALKEIIPALLTQPNREDAARLIFKFIMDSGIQRAGIPMAVAHPLNTYTDVHLEPPAREGEVQLIPAGENGLLFSKSIPRDNYLVHSLQTALNLLGQNANNDALQIIESVLSLADIPVLFYLKAIALVKLNRNGEAVSSLTQLLSRDPNHSEGRNLLSQLTQIQ